MGLAKRITSMGADIHSHDHLGCSVLHTAVMRDNVELGIDKKSFNKDKDRPISKAVKRNSHRSLRVLLEQGVSLNGRSNNGRRILHAAATRENRETMKILSEATSME
jgi:uncharacterized protein